MNRIYKVVWSKVKHAYVVTSELAKSHTKSASGKAAKAVLATAVGIGFLMGGYAADAADTATGSGNGVAYGTGSNAPKAENVAIGKDATISYSGGVGMPSTGDIVIGNKARTNNYIDQGGGIAIGSNSFVENMVGGLERSFDFNQAGYNSLFGVPYGLPKHPDKMVTGVAIGQNTYARSGSVMLGTHNYKGTLGDVTVDSADVRSHNLLPFATALGANSYSHGLFSSVTGAYSIISSNYDGNNSSAAGKNFGATITGSLNSIESATSSSNYSGVANSIVGTANRTFNSNGSLIFGAGNEITNSITSISAPSGNSTSAKDLADTLRAAVKTSKSGGATLAIGGGNTADWTQLSQIIGVNNTLKGTSGAISKFNMIDGYKNTVTKAEHVFVIGSENTVENSKSQTVIGDSNKITDRNAGTVSGHQEERTKNVSDLVIGKGNDISGNDTYMKGYESLTVIGNNNKAVNPSSGIVIGDNQKLSAIKESVVIGSMTPEEKADSDIQQKHASVVVGYHAQSGTRDGGGMNVALGHGAKAYGWQETVTGIKSIVEAGDSGYDGYLASVYGGLNTVASNKADQNDGMANTVVGTLNKTEGANGALVFGAGNSVTHSFGTAPTDEDGNSMNEHWGDTIFGGGQRYAIGEGPLGHDELRKAMGLAMSTGGGSVVTMGNGNTSDYAVHSQIIGSGNILTGTANTPSINNTINGYANTGRNVERMSMMGTGNNMSGSTADVVIGDYHHMDGGKNNVILGSMATEKKTVEKTYTLKDASGNVILEKKYKVTENVPIKSHTANISNAVMLGYNTDVEKDGGVALGADSIASVDKGVAGYDPAAGDHANDTTGTWKATAAAVSVGKAATPTSAAVTRQITNVAAGTQDTDAVNVAQLKAVKSAAAAAKTHYYSVNDAGYHTGNYNNDGAKGGMALAAGAGAAANGTASTVTGTFSRVDGNGTAGFGGFQGATSSVYGTFNVVGAKSGVEFDGVANSIIGVANKTENANASLIFGAGNKVTNSYRPVNGFAAGPLANALQTAINTGNTDDMINALGDLVKDSGGAVLAIGGANIADYAQLSKLVGVGNKLTGTAGNESKYNMIDGYLNIGKNINHVSVIGSENTVDDTNDALVLGNKRKLTGANGSIILGSGDSVITTSALDAVSIGHNANVTVSGGVALGSRSVAAVDAGVAGYDPSTKAASTDTSSTWKATEAAVSVGDATKHVTRQITGVAAGSEDTDAVNVAQLKKVEAKAEAAEKKHTTVKAGDYATVTETTNADGGKEYTVSGPKMESTDGSVRITDKVENGKKVGYNLSVDTSSLGIEKTAVKAGDNVTVTSEKTGNTTTYTVNAKDTVVTGGTASYAADGTGTATLINNDGTTATITGLQDRYTSSASLSGDTLNFTRNDGSTYSVSGIASSQDIRNVTSKVNKLDTRVNRVGAGAAALAALHPLDFNPDDKWDFAVGYGNYKDAHAVAVGAFYRPNEDTMFSVGGSLGGGENMVNAGLSVKLGQGNGVSTSKVAMAKEIVDLKDAVTRLEAQNEQFRQIIGQMAGKHVDVDFPDVPKDHWAYQYVKSLADRGLLEGYPDGEFKGDRSMTRYEFAAIIYRALQNGAPVDGNMGKAMDEFGPEIEKVREAYRFRVDRVSGGDNDRHKVERVRVNNKDHKDKNEYRDVYGSHISPKAK